MSRCVRETDEIPVNFLFSGIGSFYSKKFANQQRHSLDQREMNLLVNHSPETGFALLSSSSHHSPRLVSDSLAVFLFFAARTLPHEEEEEEEQRVAGAQVNSSFSANKKIRRWSDDGGGGYSLAFQRVE